MKKKILSAALLSMLSMSGFAMSQATGIYVGVDGGYGDLMSPSTYMNGTSGSFKRGDFVWSGNLGYNYALDQHWGVGAEVGYADNGKSEYHGGFQTNDTGSLNIKSTMLDLLGTGSYMWTNGINLFGKLGLAKLTQSGNTVGPVSINNDVKQNSDTGSTVIRPMLVLGAGYQVTPKLNLYVSGTYVFAQDFNNFNYVAAGTNQQATQVLSVAAVKIGFTFNFGG